MFGLGIWEFAIILIVALLVLGPEKLPKVARQLGRVTRELRRAVNEFQSSLTNADFEARTPPRPTASIQPPPPSAPSASAPSASAPPAASTPPGTTEPPGR